MSRISQIKDHRRVRASTSTVLSEDLLEVDSAVKAKGAVRKDVNPMTLVVARSVEDGDLGTISQDIHSIIAYSEADTHIASLYEIACYQ